MSGHAQPRAAQPVAKAAARKRHAPGETPGETPEHPIRITAIDVCPGRLTCRLRFAPGCPRRTDASLAEAAAQAYPSLPRHACVNEVGGRFGEVMADTPLPHLLEHIAIAAQARDNAAKAPDVPERAKEPNAAGGPGGAPLFVGTSEWLDEKTGLACVELSFVDDLAALSALNEAVGFLNALLSKTPGTASPPQAES